MPNPSVPADEIQRLAAAVVKADEAATAGRILTGYLIIYQGCIQAEGSREKWGPAAATLWRQALEEYKTAHPSNWGELD